MRLIEDNGHKYFEVGSRRWPVADSFREDHDMHNPSLTYDGWMRTRGCLVKFETGWAVSIIWGNLTYSSNRNMNLLDECPPFTEEPSAVEIMVLNRNHEAATADDDAWDTVLGWVTESEMIDLFDLLAIFPTNAKFSYQLIRKEYE